MKRKGEEVKEKILDILWLKPLTIQQISKKIDSNWLTVEKFVIELKREDKIKEVISTDKLTLFQKVNEDTYYNLPLKNEDRDMFKYIFSEVLRKYKNKGKIPKKTELAKAVVDVVNKSQLNLPVVWYLYGKIPLMITDPQRDYSTSYIPQNHEIIIQVAKKVVDEQKHNNTSELKAEHYLKYANEIYKIKEELLSKLENFKDEEKIIDLFNELFVACPIYEDKEAFFLTDRLIMVVRKLNLLSLLKENKRDIMFALDALWRFLTLYHFVESLSKDTRYSKIDIINFYLGSVIETKKYTAKESISNLESVYFNNISKIDIGSIKLSPEVQKIREIMEEWTGED